KKDYAEFLVTRDLEWLVTYVEAFESIVVVGVPQWVDLGWGETYFSGADERVVRLWRWHLAEEYEHRTVAYRLFKRVCSGTPEEVEQKRVDMLNFFLGHLHQRLLPVRSYLLEVDRASMTPEELAASQQRERQVDARLEEFNAAVADVMAPTWDPAILPPPERLAEAFALVE
ncbi:MAG TPA: metal-dependent hydrolase, partial [Acidimicrobiales bacterium]|nr:metal-dependent hydrolase [Acidimicrobiales bacterium]